MRRDLPDTVFAFPKQRKERWGCGCHNTRSMDHAGLAGEEPLNGENIAYTVGTGTSQSTFNTEFGGEVDIALAIIAFPLRRERKCLQNRSPKRLKNRKTFTGGAGCSEDRDDANVCD